MHINIPQRFLNAMTDQELDNINRDNSNIQGLESLQVNLITMSQPDITRLRAALERLKETGARRVNPLITDIDRWLEIISEGTSGQHLPRTLQQFADLLTEYIRTSPGHRIYQQQDDSDTWLTYYVNHIEYEREHRSRGGGYNAAHVKLHLLHWMLGVQMRHTVTFYNDEADRRTVIRALADKGILTETPQLRTQYLEAKDKFDKFFPQVGRQCIATGNGTLMDLRWGANLTPMLQNGTPGRVVIDILNDSDEIRPENNRGLVQPNFWNNKRPTATRNANSEDLAGNRDMLEKEYDQTLTGPPEIPIHPYIPVYHLSRHQRYRINVMDLQEYEFNKNLGQQLVLPQITKNLVDMLVSQGRIAFQDIIEGKGTGACILLGGPPGVGKTLTAEVFAESTERPLLSVQAAQLGTNPDNIEKQLLQVLNRGSRWNAVILLDEADVYINERGTDLQQNAIVAAFLRILEHHTATIFLTTNHINKVDDAVRSRCLARIDYSRPSVADQRRIWQILNTINEAGLTEPELDQIIRENNNLSGRDIKQTLKLASLWSRSQGKQLDSNAVAFVKDFLPTRQVS